MTKDNTTSPPAFLLFLLHKITHTLLEISDFLHLLTSHMLTFCE